ncbi:MAG: nicotinamidase [Fibrella sp.]|nr:nicotinamidase [Armatimonadota bacterium]
MRIQKTDALLIVDVQNTFCPGGSLPVADGDAVVAPINRIMPLFDGRVYASQDWHPPDHCSFIAQGGIWPPHAIQGTGDAELHPDLDHAAISHIVRKGINASRDAYSAFDGTDLASILRDAGIQRVFVTGLATDYCVKASGTDAVSADFEVVAVTDAMRPVDVSPGDGDTALAAMQSAGVAMVTSDALS